MALPPPRGRPTRTSLADYARRVVQYPQMDIEYNLWQMLYLCLSPQTVYRSTSYHKQTKNQWARDDPAFVVLQVYFLVVSSIAYTVAFGQTSLTTIVLMLLRTIVLDFLAVGVVIATITWAVANRFMRVRHTVHSVEQRVEWLYAFDVHCNAFFPCFLLTHVVPFFLIHLLLSPSFVALFLANTLYLIAGIAYCYITFLGFNVLPFLKNAVWYLYPVPLLAVSYLLLLVFRHNYLATSVASYF